MRAIALKWCEEVAPLWIFWGNSLECPEVFMAYHCDRGASKTTEKRHLDICSGAHGGTSQLSGIELVQNEPTTRAAKAPCRREELTGREKGSWSHTNDEGCRYEVGGCELNRPTQAFALQCLQQRHLLFVGDSISRHLYLTPALFLVNG
jgi:hypothetical protein